MSNAVLVECLCTNQCKILFSNTYSVLQIECFLGSLNMQKLHSINVSQCLSMCYGPSLHLEGSAEAMNMPHMMVHPLFAFLNTFSASWQVTKEMEAKPTRQT